MSNRSGAYPTPDAKSLLTATEGVDWSAAEDFAVTLSDAAPADAYPIMATSFVVIRKSAMATERRGQMMGFFHWALEHGQAQATALGYLPLPEALVRRVEGYWAAQLHTALK